MNAGPVGHACRHEPVSSSSDVSDISPATRTRMGKILDGQTNHLRRSPRIKNLACDMAGWEVLQISTSRITSSGWFHVRFSCDVAIQQESSVGGFVLDTRALSRARVHDLPRYTHLQWMEHMYTDRTLFASTKLAAQFLARTVKNNSENATMKNDARAALPYFLPFCSRVAAPTTI